jgi:hypothetical protein
VILLERQLKERLARDAEESEDDYYDEEDTDQEVDPEELKDQINDDLMINASPNIQSAVH